MHLITSITPMDICSPYSCVVTQQQCTAALIRAECIPHCSLLLCKTGSEHAFSHINNTYGHLLSTQLCCDPRTLHCSTAKGRMHSPLFTAALLNRLTKKDGFLGLVCCCLGLRATQSTLTADCSAIAVSCFLCSCWLQMCSHITQ